MSPWHEAARKGAEPAEPAFLATYAAAEVRLRAGHAAHPDLSFWLLTFRYGQRVSEALVA